MIIAVEGPDCCGKSTLFRALRADIRLSDAVFVSNPYPPEALRAAQAVQAVEAGLWEQLYDPRKLYVCERFFAVSAPVYDKLRGRQKVDYSRWSSEVRVLLLEVPEWELKRRLAARGDASFVAEDYKKLRDLYDAQAVCFAGRVLNGMSPIDRLVDMAVILTNNWWRGVECEQ